MKVILLTSFFTLAFSFLQAQTTPVNNLPFGKYETTMYNRHGKWEMGDIILLDDKRYKISTKDEVGDYRFSITAQRIFFISGPLKTVYAKIATSESDPAIVIPKAENEQKGLRIAEEDVWGVYRKE